VVDVAVEVSIDDLQRASELDRRGWVVGGDQGLGTSVVNFGVEVRGALSVGGELVDVRAGQSDDQALVAEASES
jgi:hypothetical protein